MTLCGTGALKAGTKGIRKWAFHHFLASAQVWYGGKELRTQSQADRGPICAVAMGWLHDKWTFLNLFTVRIEISRSFFAFSETLHVRSEGCGCGCGHGRFGPTKGCITTPRQGCADPSSNSGFWAHWRSTLCLLAYLLCSPLFIFLDLVPPLPCTPKAKTSFPGSGSLPPSILWAELQAGKSSIPVSERGSLAPPLELPLTQNCHRTSLPYLCPTSFQPGLEHVQTALSGILKKRSGKIPLPRNRTGVSGTLSKQRLSPLVRKG